MPWLADCEQIGVESRTKRRIRHVIRLGLRFHGPHDSFWHDQLRNGSTLDPVTGVRTARRGCTHPKLSVWNLERPRGLCTSDSPSSTYDLAYGFIPVEDRCQGYPHHSVNVPMPSGTCLPFIAMDKCPSQQRTI
jgi:hypothetical protein